MVYRKRWTYNINLMCYSCRPIPDLETNGYKKRVNILTGLGSNFVAMRIFTDKTLNWPCKYHEIVLRRKQNMKYSTYILNQTKLLPRPVRIFTLFLYPLVSRSGIGLQE
jgi:hypothetical protein